MNSEYEPFLKSFSETLPSASSAIPTFPITGSFTLSLITSPKLKFVNNHLTFSLASFNPSLSPTSGLILHPKIQSVKKKTAKKLNIFLPKLVILIFSSVLCFLIYARTISSVRVNII